jgi:hypothetical protein
MAAAASFAILAAFCASSFVIVCPELPFLKASSFFFQPTFSVVPFFSSRDGPVQSILVLLQWRWLPCFKKNDLYKKL